MQNEILQEGLLLDESGMLKQAGYARHLLIEYNREQIKKGFGKMKEWDTYYIYNTSHAFIINVSIESGKAIGKVTLISFSQRWHRSAVFEEKLPELEKFLKETYVNSDTKLSGLGYTLWLKYNENTRRIMCHADNFMNNNPIDADISLLEIPDESIVSVTPFEKKKTCFDFNQDIVGIKVFGIVRFENKEYLFPPENSVAVFKRKRSLFSGNPNKICANASGNINGKLFGFNLSKSVNENFENAENAIFYENKIYKLGKVKIDAPSKNDLKLMNPWQFTDEEDHIHLTFQPEFIKKNNAKGILKNDDKIIIFGFFTGGVSFDDETAVRVDDFFGFVEM